MNCRTQKNVMTFSNTGQVSSILQDKKQMFRSELQMEVTKPALDLKKHKILLPTPAQGYNRLTSHLIKHTCSVSPSGLSTGSLGFVRALGVYFFRKHQVACEKINEIPN